MSAVAWNEWHVMVVEELVESQMNLQTVLTMRDMLHRLSGCYDDDDDDS